MGKKISLPWVGIFDISEIEDIVDTEVFQAGFGRTQTGFSNLVFRSANSTRAAIELITWYVTKKYATRRLVEDRWISPEVAHQVNLISLLHDVGHGPFSHTIEFMTKINHEENGARLIETNKKLREAIGKCGGDPDFMTDCLRKKRPEFVIVDDKNFGTDKLVYLVMAYIDTGFGPHIERVVKDVLTYNYYYKDFFICKSTLKVQRYMQKMIYRLLKQGAFSEEALWAMTDQELLSRFIGSDDPVIRQAYKNYTQGVDVFPRTGLTIRLRGHAYMEGEGKDNMVTEAPREFFDRFNENCTPEFLDMLENEIAEGLGISPDHLIVVSISPKDLEKRFRPQDINIRCSVDRNARSLMELREEHFTNLTSDYKDSLAIRICVEPRYRGRLYRKGMDIHRLIAEKIGYLQ
jgi:hypothetical protein